MDGWVGRVVMDATMTLKRGEISAAGLSSPHLHLSSVPSQVSVKMVSDRWVRLNLVSRLQRHLRHDEYQMFSSRSTHPISEIQ